MENFQQFFTDKNIILILNMNLLFYMYIPIIIIFLLIVVLFFLILKNKQNIQISHSENKVQDTSMQNIIDAVNYNDKLLFKNQKYIHSVYEENNNFEDLKHTEDVKQHPPSEKQYYNMMKNYDALTHLSK